MHQEWTFSFSPFYRNEKKGWKETFTGRFLETLDVEQTIFYKIRWWQGLYDIWLHFNSVFWRVPTEKKTRISIFGPTWGSPQNCNKSGVLSRRNLANILFYRKLFLQFWNFDNMLSWPTSRSYSETNRQIASINGFKSISYQYEAHVYI